MRRQAMQVSILDSRTYSSTRTSRVIGFAQAMKRVLGWVFTPSRLLLLIIVASLVILLNETLQKTITVEPFEVPKKLADLGYTPRVVAQHIIDNIHSIYETTESRTRLEVLGEWDISNSDFEIPTTGRKHSVHGYFRR